MKQGVCCKLRDGFRWGGVGSVAIGLIVFMAAAPVTVIGTALGADFMETVLVAMLIVASFTAALGCVIWPLSHLPRWRGRRAGCEHCLRDGDPISPFEQVRARVANERSMRPDPDRSGVRLRPTAPQEESGSA